MRKPERRIYEHTLRALNVEPSEAIFLDDLGVNLKAAKELGITTIKVHDLLVLLNTDSSACLIYLSLHQTTNSACQWLW